MFRKKKSFNVRISSIVARWLERKFLFKDWETILNWEIISELSFKPLPSESTYENKLVPDFPTKLLSD